MEAGTETLELHVSNVDEVPTYWVPRPGPVEAALIFGVGTADEPLFERGITRATAALATYGAERKAFELDVLVDDAVTMVRVRGTMELVRAALEYVAWNISRPPVDEADWSPTIEPAPGTRAVTSGLGSHLVARWGRQGPGVVDTPEFGASSFGVDDVTGWLGNWFGAANAALAIAGPDLESVLVDLPAGPEPVHAPIPASAVTDPSFTFHDGELVSMSALRPPSPTWTMATSALRLAYDQRLRIEERSTDAVRARTLRVGSDGLLNVLAANPVADDPGSIRNTMSALYDRLRRAGPTDGEMERLRAMRARAAVDPRRALTWAILAARGSLFAGHAIEPAEHLAAHAAVTATQIAEALDRAHETLLWSVPVGTPIFDLRYRSVGAPPAPDIDGTTFGAGVGTDDPSRTLVVGRHGISLTAGGRTRAMTWDDVTIACRYDDRTWTLWGSDGTAVEVSARDWHRGANAVSEIRRRVPSDRVVHLGAAARPDEDDADPDGSIHEPGDGDD